MTVSPAPAKPRFWTRAYAKALAVAKNPVLRPMEVWALRAVFAAVAVKLGLDASSL